MDIIQTENAISSYFNNTLRESLKYHETYLVTFDYNNPRLTLIPSSINAELINQIKVIKGLKNKIEQTLLSAFQNKNPDITNINLYIIDNNIIITIIQNDRLFSLPEEIILAKLASGYDINELTDVCRINVNFAKACRSDLFWWEIIKIKFPKYYKEKRNHNYNPKELIKGLDYFRRISKLPKHVKKIYLINSFDINNLYLNYYETLRYLVLENLWSQSNINLNLVADTIIEVGESINLDTDLEILKILLKRVPLPGENVMDIIDDMVMTVHGLKLAKRLDIYLISQGKEPIFKDIDLQVILEYDIMDSHGNNDPEYYELLSSMLNHPQINQRYLQDYGNSDMDHDKLQDYMLSKTSPNVDKDLLIQTGLHILNRGDKPTFVRFYKHFLKRWTQDDIKIFKDVVDRLFGDDPEFVKEFDELFKIY